MTRGKLIVAGILVFACGSFDGPAAEVPQGTVFRAGVNLVRVGASVRDKRGRFVRNLTDKNYRLVVSPVADDTIAFMGRPRTYGVSVSVRY